MGNLRPLPCPPQPCQPGWPVLHQAPVVDAHLDEVRSSSRSFSSALKSMHRQQGRVAEGLPDPLPVVGHVLHRLVEAEEAGVEPGRWNELGEPGRMLRPARSASFGQQVALQVAGQVDLLLAVAVAGAEGVGGLRGRPRT